MLFKLSRHSMKKMLKDYMVLLIGLVISISIFLHVPNDGDE